MKSAFCLLLATFVVLVTGDHTFIGTNVDRELLYNYHVRAPAIPFQKRVKNLSPIIPPTVEHNGKVLQGIMAYDLTHKTADAKVTVGGINFTYANIRLKSERGQELHYDVHVYI